MITLIPDNDDDNDNGDDYTNDYHNDNDYDFIPDDNFNSYEQ